MTRKLVLAKSLKGHCAELLVEAFAILGAPGRLSGFSARSDVDHKDLIIDEVGGFLDVYLQVKCATGLDAEGHIVCTAHYPVGQIPSHPRFIYVLCLLDQRAMDLSRIFVIPSPDLNRLAYREKRGPDRVQLLFECRASGDPRWDRFEVAKRELGKRLVQLIEAAPEVQVARFPGVALRLAPIVVKRAA